MHVRFFFDKANLQHKFSLRAIGSFWWKDLLITKIGNRNFICGKAPAYFRTCLARLLLRGSSRGAGAVLEEPQIVAPPKWLRLLCFFTEKRLLQENVWQGSSGGAGAGAGEEPCQTGPINNSDYQGEKNLVLVQLSFLQNDLLCSLQAPELFWTPL